MLTVNEKPVVAGVGELLSDGWAVAVDEDAELGLACAEGVLEVLAGLDPSICRLHNHIHHVNT